MGFRDIFRATLFFEFLILTFFNVVWAGTRFRDASQVFWPIPTRAYAKIYVKDDLIKYRIWPKTFVIRVLSSFQYNLKSYRFSFV